MCSTQEASAKYRAPPITRSQVPEQGEGGRSAEPRSGLGDDRLARRTGSADQAGSIRALAALAEGRIVGLTADLGKYTGSPSSPRRTRTGFYQMGMAEQLLMATAARMAREASCRSPPPMRCSRRRCLRLHLPRYRRGSWNAKIVCALPGLTTNTARAVEEDLAIFRGMPNLVILDPATQCRSSRCSGDRDP